MDVCAALLKQAEMCARFGSPFTARICRLLAGGILEESEVGKEALAWPGDAGPTADSLPLRITGALHSLARSGRTPALSAVYPPAETDDVRLAGALRAALAANPATLREFLARPPQTNEVARAAPLLAGLLEIAAVTALPLALHEIGSSAGLNLILDRYRYRFGEATWGDPQSSLELAPHWQGHPPPIHAPLAIARRSGNDIAPVDLADAGERERLLSYVWPDQFERLTRLEAALAAAASDPPRIVSGDAAQWLERELFPTATRKETRVLMHSLVWSYLEQSTRERIAELVEGCAEKATSDAPLAWLAFELDPDRAHAALRLRIWPGPIDRVLAVAHPHGTQVHWLA